MLTPSNRTITIASGGTALVGRTTAIPAPGGGGSSNPAWLVSAAPTVNQVVAIPGTSGFGGASTAFSGWIRKPATGEIFMAAPGGHHDSSDNRVVGIRILDDAPAWAIRAPGGTPSTTAVEDVAYYPDGKPTSRHLYQMLQYVPSTDRLLLCGCRVAWGNAYGFTKTDTFNLATNTWDAAGYNQDVPAINGAAVTDYDGVIWASLFAGKYIPSTRTWGAAATGGNSVGPIRHPWATDAVNRQIFGIAFSDGEDHQAAYGSTLSAGVMRNGVVASVTITPGAGLTRFMAEKPAYAAMDYDPVNDCFIYYDAATNHFYKIVLPVTGNTAAMTIYTPDFSAFTPELAESGGGVMCRFTYFPELKGFVGGPAIGNMFLLKTST